VPHEKRRSKTIASPPKESAIARARSSHVQTLGYVEGLTDQEKSVHALGLAATPQERWDIFERFMRSRGYWTPLKPKK
jgi:hypothetical protein